MSDELLCPECGEGPFGSAAGLSGHVRFKHAEKGAPERPSGAPALIPEWRQTPKVRVGIRSVTMLDPRCRICQNAENVARDWYRSCPHDPYVTIVPIKEPRPVLEDEVVDGKPTGRKKVTGMEDFISYHPRPNTRGISLTNGSNSGNGVEWARRKGFILPSELRSPTYPDGIAETCQFHDCKAQTGLKRYGAWGTYCRETEARLVWHYESGKTLEVGEWNDEAIQRREEQLAEAPVGQGVAVA